MTDLTGLRGSSWPPWVRSYSCHNKQQRPGTLKQGPCIYSVVPAEIYSDQGKMDVVSPDTYLHLQMVAFPGFSSPSNPCVCPCRHLPLFFCTEIECGTSRIPNLYPTAESPPSAPLLKRHRSYWVRAHLQGYGLNMVQEVQFVAQPWSASTALHRAALYGSDGQCGCFSKP